MKKTSAFALVVAISLLGGLTVKVLRHRAESAAEPNIDGLTDSLKRAAEKGLSAPALASYQLTLTAPTNEIQARAKGVIDAAIQAGGTAIKTDNADGTILLLVKIPALNVGLFRGLLEKAEVVSERPAPAGETVLIEITIKTP